MNVNSLRDIIVREVSGLIDRDYWLCDVPHYGNVGDVAIWQGTLDALRAVPYRCIRQVSCWSPQQPKGIDGGLVLFKGGGNFGDVWPTFQDYHKMIMRNNPSCRFVVLPQTAYWRDRGRMKEEAAFFANFDCTIYVRDKMSFDILSANFRNPIRLAPDFAFACDLSRYTPPRTKGRNRTLFLKREDCEKCDVARVPIGAEVSDWPTASNDFFWHRVRHVLGRTCRCSVQSMLYDAFVNGVYRPYVLRTGLRFLLSYDTIYSTRLHGAILGVMLGKRVKLYDNAYGKNRAVYETWLKDSDLCEFQY